MEKRSMKKILVVDDEKTARKGYLAHLALDIDKKEYEIDAVGDKDQAINYLSENKRIELIVLDLALPTLQEGFQIINKIRQETISTRVLIVSCHANKIENSLEGVEIHGFLAKPIKWARIGKISKNIIAQPKINRSSRPKNKITTREILLSLNRLSALERFEITKILIKNLSQASKQELINRIYRIIELNKSQGKDPEKDPLDLDFDSPEIVELCKYKYGNANIQYNPTPNLRYFDGPKQYIRTLPEHHPAVQKDLLSRDKDLELTKEKLLRNKEENKKNEKIQKIKKLLKSEEDAIEMLKIILLEYPGVLKNLVN